MKFYDAEGNEVDPFAATQNDPTSNNPDIKRLRDAFEKDLPAQINENKGLKLQLAMRDAGITKEQIASDPKLSFFIENYKGEPTLEAFQAEATKFGFIEPVADPAVAQAAQGQAAVVAASTGTTPSDNGSDMNAGLQKAYQDGAAQGRGVEAMQDYARQHNIPIVSR